MNTVHGTSLLTHLFTTSKVLGVLSNPKGLLLADRPIWQVTDIATDAAFPLSPPWPAKHSDAIKDRKKREMTFFRLGRIAPVVPGESREYVVARYLEIEIAISRQLSYLRLIQDKAFLKTMVIINITIYYYYSLRLNTRGAASAAHRRILLRVEAWADRAPPVPTEPQPDAVARVVTTLQR